MRKSEFDFSPTAGDLFLPILFTFKNLKKGVYYNPYFTNSHSDYKAGSGLLTGERSGFSEEHCSSVKNNANSTKNVK